jgi:hypothetical protein
MDENNNPTPAINGLEWKTYSNDKFGFSVEYPSNWIINEKTNRFEFGPALSIQSTEDPTSPLSGKFDFVKDGQPPFNDITRLTEFGKEGFENKQNVNYEIRVVDDVNSSKYTIGGKKRVPLHMACHTKMLILW